MDNKEKNRKKKIKVILGICIFILLLGGGGWFIYIKWMGHTGEKNYHMWSGHIRSECGEGRLDHPESISGCWVVSGRMAVRYIRQSEGELGYSLDEEHLALHL